jgi:2-keto-4-pentenoate hydratase/2-oxohepta-3-ene-1,7-dioic acid hydratase in catechol pathway
MRIARCRLERRDFWAVIEPSRRVARELRGSISEWGPALLDGKLFADLVDAAEHSMDALRLLAPLEPTGRIICIGTNYGAHLAEAGLQMPSRPVAFLKPYSAMVGPEDEIDYPALTDQLDYEIEFVIAVGASIAPDADPMLAVLGYSIGNDVSARDLQVGPGGAFGLDLYSGKCLDRTSSLGPWIVTRDEFAQRLPDLAMQLTVDEEIRQQDRTSSMHWSLEDLLRYADARTRLLPGDIIFTGTPAGVGYSSGRFLQPGNMVAATIENIGTLRNKVGRRPPQ